MIRVLHVPVIGVEEQFRFGCWSAQSQENFDKYVDGFDSGEHDDTALWSGWLCSWLENLIPGTEPPAICVQRRPATPAPLGTG